MGVKAIASVGVPCTGQFAQRVVSVLATVGVLFTDGDKLFSMLTL